MPILISATTKRKTFQALEQKNGIELARSLAARHLFDRLRLRPDDRAPNPGGRA
jgi:hypothetical protein